MAIMTKIQVKSKFNKEQILRGHCKIKGTGTKAAETFYPNPWLVKILDFKTWRLIYLPAKHENWRVASKKRQNSPKFCFRCGILSVRAFNTFTTTDWSFLYFYFLFLPRLNYKAEFKLSINVHNKNERCCQKAAGEGSAHK